MVSEVRAPNCPHPPEGLHWWTRGCGHLTPSHAKPEVALALRHLLAAAQMPTPPLCPQNRTLPPTTPPQPPHAPGHWAGLPGGPIHTSGFSEGKGGLATWFLEPSRAPAVGNSSPPTSGLPPGPRRERKRTRTRARDGKASGARTPQNCKADPGIILKSNISKMKVSVPKASAAAGIRWAGPWRLRLKPSPGESRLLQRARPEGSGFALTLTEKARVAPTTTG